MVASRSPLWRSKSVLSAIIARSLTSFASVSRQLLATLRDLGFVASTGGSCTVAIDGHVCRVGLQKFRNQPAFRVIYSFKPDGGTRDDAVVEYSDPYTYRYNSSGRQFDFGIRWGDDPVAHCLSEIHDFVRDIAIPWPASQSAAASEGG